VQGILSYLSLLYSIEKIVIYALNPKWVLLFYSVNIEGIKIIGPSLLLLFTDPMIISISIYLSIRDQQQ